MKYVAALDQGTTSSRTLVFDEDLNVVAMAQREFRQIYPEPGWVEHNPYDILSTQTETLREAVSRSGIAPKDLVAVGIANQRETMVVWEKDTGRPVSNAIVWQCRRTADTCKKLQQDGLETEITQRTGLVADAYFSGTKIRWVLDNVPAAHRNADAGDLLCGTVDSWLLWNITEERRHLTDVTNASRTMLFNLKSLQWDAEMLRMLGVPASMLPETLPCTAEFGHLRKDILGVSVPVCAVMGDQQAALFGQACFRPGEAKTTYGTGCFLLMNTGAKPVYSQNRLLSTVAWDTGQGPTYALEGSVFTGGAAIQWLRDELGLIRTSAESEELALSVSDTGGVVLVPAFTGLGAPWWDMYARGAIVGMTRGTNRAHIARATLEAIAFQCADVLAAMKRDAGMHLERMKADGGASANGFLMQFQADLLGVPVIRPACAETTALGAACAAGLHAGVFRDIKDVASRWQASREYSPAGDPAARASQVRNWHKAVDKAKHWLE